MRLTECLENSGKVQALVVHDLSEMGVAIDRRTYNLAQHQFSKDPSEKLKKIRGKDESLNPGCSTVVFGNSLSHVPCVAAGQFGAVPEFLCSAVQLLEKHLTVEGLFRRSASMARLKDLRVRVDAGEALSEDTLPLDVASLVKQFFRELPEPLLTSVLYENFLQCIAIDNEPGQVEAILLLCLLLPAANLSTLRYLMHFLAQVASFSEQNKMDASNLAVCLTPNLLHAGGAGDKTDRVNVNGGGPLQAETGVIRLLILNTDRIGLVSDGLLQRVALLSSCFPLCDDLEAGEIRDETPKMRKKKNKKRSGSLQGLVTSFSSSFSRWRNKDKQSQNSSLMSDRSALSYISFEKSSVVMGDRNTAKGDLDATIEATDFSLCPTMTPCLIRKRKAEEEFVPFSAKKRHAILSSMPHKSLLAGTPFTPRIKNDAELDPTPHIDFAPGADIVFSATPQVPMPMMRMNKLLSSGSSARLSRNSLGRSGCFSPKTHKKSLRNSFRGLLRRLSGSKDCSQSQMQLTNLSDSNASHLSCLPGASHLDGSASKAPGSGKKGISLFRRRKKHLSSPAAQVMTGLTGDYVEHEMNGVIEVDLSFVMQQSAKDEGGFAVKGGRSPRDLPPRPRPRSRSAEGLRRGRPNTMKAGLPSPARRRSVEVKQRRNMDRRMDSAAPSGVLDTSPIHRCSTDGESKAFASPEQLDPKEMTHQGLIKMYSGSKMSVESMELIDCMTDQLDSEHDRAFTEESILMHEEGALDVDAEIRHVAAVTHLSKESEEEGLGVTVTSGDGMPSNSEIPVSVESVSKRLLLNVDTQHTEKGSLVGKALVDADSAVDLAASESWGQLQHCRSRQSIKSQDSGLGLNMDGEDVGVTPVAVEEKQENEAVQVQSMAKEENVTRAHDHSLMYMKEGRQSIGVRSSFRQKKADPCLQVSAEVHQLLSKAGSLIVDIKSANVGGTATVADTKGRCSIPKTGIISHLSLEEEKQVSERCSSPLRFAKATSRTIVPAKVPSSSGHISPRSSFRKAPALPISTNLLRVSFKENCQGKPSVVCPATKEATVNPLQLISETAEKDDQSLPEVDAQLHKIDSNPNATPKIKSALVTPGMANRLGKRGFPLQAIAITPVAKTTRSPLRPLKRLQASPKSPRGQRSPRRMTSPGKNIRLATGMTLAVPLSDLNV